MREEAVHLWEGVEVEEEEEEEPCFSVDWGFYFGHCLSQSRRLKQSERERRRSNESRRRRILSQSQNESVEPWSTFPLQLFFFFSSAFFSFFFISLFSISCRKLEKVLRKEWRRLMEEKYG